MSPVNIITTSPAAVLHGAKDLRIEDRPVWSPGPGEAQVSVEATGLCGSDLHYYLHGRNGDFALRAPMVLGHEAAGVILSLGPPAPPSSLRTHPSSPPPHVQQLHIGQRVAIEAGIACTTCSFCLSGRYNLCNEMRFASSAKTYPHLDGTLRGRMNHPARYLHPLPDGCSFEQAALAEPLSVLIHASRRASLAPSTSSSPFSNSSSALTNGGTAPKTPKSVLVLGAGTVGLLACALAKSYDPANTHVVVVDINQQRLDFAVREGFASDAFKMPVPSQPTSSHTTSTTPKPNGVVPNGKAKVNSATPNGVQPNGASQPPSTVEEAMLQASQRAKEIMHAVGEEDGFDVVFECTGVEGCIQMGVYAAKTGGKLMLIGMGTRNVVLPISTAAVREVDILGSFRYANTYPEALSLLASNALGPNVTKLVTHRFTLAESARAFETLAKGTDESGGMVIKVMVGP